MSSITTPNQIELKPKAGGKRTTILLALVGLACVGGVWTAVAIRAPSSPNEDAAKLAKIGSSPEFAKADAEKQRQWMLSMGDRKDQIVAAFRSGRLSEQEYRMALNLAWMSKQEGHMTKYYRLPLGKERDAYLDKLAKRHYAAKDAAKTDPDLDDDFNHDSVWEQTWIAKWPAEKRAQYEAFRKAMEERRDAYKAAFRKKTNQTK